MSLQGHSTCGFNCITNCRTIGAYWQDSRMWQPIVIACKWFVVGAGLRQLPSQPAPLSIPTSDVTHWIVSIVLNSLCGVHIKVSYIKQASYLHRRGAVYQYIRRVPCDIRPYQKTNELYFSLRTTSLLSTASKNWKEVVRQTSPWMCYGEFVVQVIRVVSSNRV